VVKDYFFQIGAFDEGLRVWGGENLELAFRAWMCGGQVTTVTCSRVGHVFKQSPNKFDGTEGTKEHTIQRNLMRVADAWMDSTRKFFYATSLVYDYKKFKLEDSEIASVRERIQQRETLKCHNFEWFLYNVIPEMNLPPMNSRYFGEIMNLHTRACWEITEDYFVGMTYFCFEHKIIPKNDFALTTDGLLRYRDRCVKLVAPTPYLLLAECPTDNFEQFGQWTVVNRGPAWGMIKVSRLGDDGNTVFWCIAQVTNILSEHTNEQMPQLTKCNENDPFQIWGFTYALDFSNVSEYLTSYT
jgi:polypeptide N-acetylgalactosaminyltransferase